MTTLKQKFIDEMELRGFSEKTTRSYVSVVREVARHFNRSPDQIADEELKQTCCTHTAGQMRRRDNGCQRQCLEVSLSTCERALLAVLNEVCRVQQKKASSQESKGTSLAEPH
jgi:hypothetical protein